ncbi:hypothetical protein E1A91_A11G128200v1 [Gossypium mustelinum]|uniref:Uncharacterized protein n=1 Tax=Gossypium mustelinum TaxID=34275 RepID=A0A5D2X563_GOSMU|nr:hypothetical protein E1A91_A11G128200v1 [Gossypium mustelinum]
MASLPLLSPEEAIVYINGTPFVLKELNKPVDTLKHVGITGPVVEHMEARLKEDILSEVRESGGRMLVHREEFSPSSNQSSVVGYWENIFTDDVKIAVELYAALKDEGYNIEYRMILLTREREALASDVDEIQNCQDDSSGCYLYVSHIGFGGVAYAMAIICCRLDAKIRDSGGLENKMMDNCFYFVSYFRQPVFYPCPLPFNIPVISFLTLKWCAGTRHLRADILHYSKELEKVPSDDDENRAYIMDMGVKGMSSMSISVCVLIDWFNLNFKAMLLHLRYFFLITFRSYLYSTSPIKMKFTTWMDARPELGHLCNNLRIDK